MAVDSKPTQDQKAKKRPRPAAGPVKALSGLMGDSGMPSGPPPENREMLNTGVPLQLIDTEVEEIEDLTHDTNCT
jgi:hypothetical protein